MTEDERIIADTVRHAADEGAQLAILGGGSKASIGRATDTQALDLLHLTGVVDYDPAELILTEFQAAAMRLLNRAGYDVIFAPGEDCCGGLVHHMGREKDALSSARRNVDAWAREIAGEGLAAIIVTSSGCGTTIKDYGFMLRGDPAYAEAAARVSELTRDVTEFLAEVGLPMGDGRGLTVAYHAACSLQHGQRVTVAPGKLLASVGYAVRTPVEAHMCCGSAGTYNIPQPLIAGQLGDRKVTNIERLAPDVIATGNIGCAVQIGQRTGIPVMHTVELLDWATGGPAPPAFRDFERIPA